MISGCAVFDEFSDNLARLKKLLDEAEAKIPIQPTLPIKAQSLLSKLTSDSQDLSSLIDVQTAMANLPMESELAALLQLCLNGDVMIKIYSNPNLVETDNE